MAIEHQTGNKYEDYVNEHILRPLELGNLHITQPTPEIVEEMAFPYKLIYNKAKPTDQLYSFPYPSGGLSYMTPSQMSRFLIAHLNNGVYNGNQLLDSELMGRFHETSFGHEFYGLGIGVEEKDGHTYLFHNGQDNYSSNFVLNLDLKTGVIVMSNAESYHQMLALIQYASDLMDGKRDVAPLQSFAKKEFSEIQMSETESARLIGTYKIEGTDFNLTILRRDGKMYLKNPANAKYEILPYEVNKFYLKTEEEQIEFTTGDHGVEGLILYSSGNKVIANRVN